MSRSDMSNGQPIPETEERVLSTLNQDGTRLWLRPKLSKGLFLNARRLVAYALIIIFTALPWLSISGKPVVLLNIPGREFIILGITFLPTDTLLLAILFLTIFITVFFITALFGRIWCGWGCPQTVYMEFVYRPLERFFEGRKWKTGQKADVPAIRRFAKYATYLVISFLLANTFIAYFVGSGELISWMQQSPAEHPTPFLIMAAVTAAMMFDFCYLREQVCTLMCPYGRFQSVMLDRQSLIISYDVKRGDPRGRLTKAKRAALQAIGSATDPTPTGFGDCIDCKLCVTTCPTGIDIRNGLQMECIGCAQCIDACDTVMQSIDRPKGLIRYSSQQAMETGNRRLLRPRVIIYPVILLVLITAGTTLLLNRRPADLHFLRNQTVPYRTMEDGRISNRLTVKITNRTDMPRTYTMRADSNFSLSSDDLPITLNPAEAGQAVLRLITDRDQFDDGRASVSITLEDDAGFSKTYAHHMLGPLFSGSSGQNDSE